MHSRYVGNEGSTIGKHLIDRRLFTVPGSERFFICGVPGDIIDGTNGNDIEETWTERFNCRGQEAHNAGLISSSQFQH